MVNYQEERVQQTNTKLNKLNLQQKTKKQQYWLNKKNFEDEELPHELFLTTRKTIKIRNAFAINMSADIKLSKTQWGGSFGSWLGNFVKINTYLETIYLD